LLVELEVDLWVVEEEPADLENINLVLLLIHPLLKMEIQEEQQ
jgi:hypothetical protein